MHLHKLRLSILIILISLLCTPINSQQIDQDHSPDDPTLFENQKPHLMPPHPSIMEQVRMGSVTLPEYLLNPDKSTQPAIDQPNLQMPTGPTGTWRAIALLVKFSDKPNTVSATFFDSLLFGTSFKQLNHYYKTVSYGQLDIVTVNLPSSIGWKLMPQTYTYYVDNKYCTDGIYPHNCRKLAEDAVAAANPVVDFSKYDNDGDGYVDTVFIIHAGRGAEFTGNSTDIWSHSWWTYTEPVVDGVKVGSYTTEPEYWNSVSSSTSDMTIGVYAHELGHAFGLPDLYDYDGSSSGVGDWSLMASGSWNGTYGDSPSFLDAWSRAKLGWVNPIVVSGLLTGGSIRNAETYQDIYKLKSSLLGTSEYFLVENRQKTSYDATLPNGGLFIWHIDEAKLTLSLPNNIECRNLNNWLCGSNHPLVALEQADGIMDLEYDRDLGDSGDPYPGSTNKRIFNSSSSPNTSSYYYTTSADTKLYVINISNSALTMTADLYVAAAPGAFSKTSPVNNTMEVAVNPTPLSWSVSSGAVFYEYCVDSINNNSCDTSWISTGANTSVSVNGLTAGQAYYWQVRSKVDSYTTEANAGVWWKFTTFGGSPPGVFTKTSPINNSVDISINPTLTWSASSASTGYEYCIDKVNDNTCTSPAMWVEVGNTTSVVLAGLEFNTSYYWQVRAKNIGGFTDASDGWWKFTTWSGLQLHLPFVFNSPGLTTLINGNFESGSGVGWLESATQSRSLIINSDFPGTITPHGGTWAAWLGGVNNDTSSISQQITIQAASSNLHLWFWSASLEILCNSDYGYVRINGNNVHTWNLCLINNTNGWRELNLNLSAYTGQTVNLEIRVVTNNINNSNLVIDDVSFASLVHLPENK